MERVPCASVIIENMEGEILLLLRDDKAGISYPDHWTLIGGKVEDDETPEMAAHRELEEETGLKTDLSFWKKYDRQHPNVIVDQYVYLGKVNANKDDIIIGEGQDIRFFEPDKIEPLKIGFGFDMLLQEYLLVRDHLR